MTQWIIIGSSLILLVIGLIFLLQKQSKLRLLQSALALVLAATVFAGCKKPDASPESTTGTESANPTETIANSNTSEKLPDIIPGESLSADELTSFTKLFSGLSKENGEINWYNIILACGWDLGEMKGFAVPEDVNLDALFNNGFRDVSNMEHWTPEESAFIQSIYPGYPTNYGDLYRLPATMMDQVLQDYLGITIEQSNKVWLDKMEYFPDTNCCFGAPAGAIGEQNINIADGKRTADGTIYLLYCKNPEGKILLRLAPNPGNEKVPYQVHTSIEIKDEGDYAEIMMAALHLPSAAAANPPSNHKYFLHHNLPNSEVMDSGYNGKPYTLENLAENGLYAVDDGVVYTISNQPVSKWALDTAGGYIYFVRQSDSRKIWRTDLHGQNSILVYESQHGDITFLRYYRDSHDWLLLIENSNRCAFFDLTAQKTTALPQVHFMEQFSYDAPEERVFWKGQLNESDPEMPLGGYTYYYYPKVDQYKILKDNGSWDTVTPEK